ncbi:hypothetical protein Hanom_Chr06g00524181 [Helianthus anomalus]
MHPIGMVRVRHFGFVCRTMHIEPTVTRFRVFHQMHCSQGFNSFMQRASAKKILLQPPKSFHDWKQKFFFIKVGIMPMRMTFRGKEDVPTKTIQTSFSENWYSDLKEVPSIALPEKTLVGAGMSLNWRMNREEKPVYMEDGKSGKMATIPKKPDEELWYHRIVRNFVLPRDDDLAVQPAAGAGELSNLGMGPEKKRRVPTAIAAPKKSDSEKAQSSKTKNMGGEKKGMCHSSDSWCDYVVVSDSLEGLAPAVVRKPKPEPRDTADIPPSNPDDPIDQESSPEHLLKKKAGKKNQANVEPEGQPDKKVRRKKITRMGNLDAFIAKPVLEKPNSHVHTKPSSVVNEELPPSPLRGSVYEQLENADALENEAEKTVEAEDSGAENPSKVVVDVGKVTSPEAVDVGAASPSMASGFMPKNIEKVFAEDQGSFSDVDKNSPIRPDETLWDYYYRTYSEKNASEIHRTFPPEEIKFQDELLHDQTYHAYLEEAATYTSTTHRIVREWPSMHKEWAAFKASKKKAGEDEARVAQLRAKLEADQPKFENDRKTEEWSITGWKRKAEAEATHLSEERKNWKKNCEKDNAEKMGLCNALNNLKAEVEKLKKQDAEIEKLKKEKVDAEAARDEARSHGERSKQREVHTCATLALRDKEIEELIALLSEHELLKAEVESIKKNLELEQTEKAETSRRLSETEEKLENSKTARATAESELEPLKSDMLWLKERGISSVAESVLNSEDLDKTVARLLVVAHNDGYAQGYAECSHHVVNALKVDWDTSKSATHGVNNDVALAAVKVEFNNLQLPVMDLINVVLQSEDHVAQLKEIFPYG